jgi:hypothetical protein
MPGGHPRLRAGTRHFGVQARMMKMTNSTNGYPFAPFVVIRVIVIYFLPNFKRLSLPVF